MRYCSKVFTALTCPKHVNYTGSMTEKLEVKKMSTVFRDAIKLIRKHGWTTGQWKAISGCMCMEGALAEAAGLTVAPNECPPAWGEQPQCAVFRGAIRTFHEVTGRQPHRFNDTFSAGIAREREDAGTMRTASLRDERRLIVLQEMGKVARQLEKQGL